MSGNFSGCWTWWVLHGWVSGFCCLPLKRVGFCSEKQLSSLWIIWSLAACFWDLLGKLWSVLHSGDHSAWTLRHDTSGFPPKAQWCRRLIILVGVQTSSALCQHWELSSLQLSIDYLPDLVEFILCKQGPVLIKNPGEPLCRLLGLFSPSQKYVLQLPATSALPNSYLHPFDSARLWFYFPWTSTCL